jgi:hypothetical protein
MTSHEIVIKIKVGLETKQKQLWGEFYDDKKTIKEVDFTRIQQGLKICKKFIDYINELLKEEET